jgi:L,D-transpeptidase ErfK/SrfK
MTKPMVRWGLLAGLALAAPAHGAEQPGSGDLIGQVRVLAARESDTLLDIARDAGLGYVEIVAANPGVDPWLPGAGTSVILPTAHLLPNAPRQGIVVNLGDFRLYYFAADGSVDSYPIGVGKDAGLTPLGRTTVHNRRINPTWFPPASVRAEDPDLPEAVPPGPDNPLGKHSLDLAWNAIRIHGTNRPWGVGRTVSHGCIRLYPEDIAKLYPKAPIGTAVMVVDQPVKLGWSGGELYLEVHPTHSQAVELEFEGKFTPAPVRGLDKRVTAAAAAVPGAVERVDWPAVRRVAKARQGIPTAITR